MKNLKSLSSSFSNFKSAYQPTDCYRWHQEAGEEPIFCLVDKVQHIIIGYRLEQIPEFNEAKDNEARETYIEAILRQKNFIDTVSNVFLKAKNNLKGFLELRIVNDPSTKTINCYLLLRLVITSNSAYYDPKRLEAEFKSLIPDDYVFKKINDNEIIDLLELSNKSLVEIRKHTNLLPVGSAYQPDNVVIAPRNFFDWDTKTRLYIPCSSYIEPKIYNLSNLYKLLQKAKETIQIRVSLGSANVYDLEKNLALQYHDMVMKTYQHINKPEMLGFEKSFTKYISTSQLFSIKIQVAADNEVSAMAIANAFCGQLSFGEIQSQSNLDCFSIQHIDSETKKSDWEECNHYYYPYFNEKSNIEGIDGAIESFMTRLPYLCDGSEAMALFRLPISNAGGLPGLIAKPAKPFYQPNPKSKQNQKEIQLGKIITSGAFADSSNNNINYALPISDLTKHGLIVGSTGSGKTNTTLNFIKELTENGIPFLLIEPVKSEYYDELSEYLNTKNIKLNRFNFKQPFKGDGTIEPDYFRFNPLIPIEGISITQHISYIKGCFNAAFPMHGIMPLILEDCLFELYGRACKLGKSGKDFFDINKSPKYLYDKMPDTLSQDEAYISKNIDLSNLEKVMEVHLQDNKLYPDPRTKQEFGGYLHRRIGKLTKGLIGNTLSPKLWHHSKSTLIPNNILTLLTKPTIIELEELADNDEKALVMAFILTMLFEYRQTKDSIKTISLEEKAAFDLSNHIHITIIEEAHRLLSSSSKGQFNGEIITQDSKSKSISLFVDMLAEIRAKGEGIFIVEQIPTKLVSDVIKNTNLKIMHRITSKDDRHYLGEAMNMTEKQKSYVTNLKTGEAIIFEEQLDNPVFVKMNEFKRNAM